MWLRANGSGWTVIDTGFSNETIRGHWRDAIDRICGGRPIKRMIVTHFHPDHLGLAGWFQEEFCGTGSVQRPKSSR